MDVTKGDVTKGGRGEGEGGLEKLGLSPILSFRPIVDLNLFCLIVKQYTYPGGSHSVLKRK